MGKHKNANAKADANVKVAETKQPQMVEINVFALDTTKIRTIDDIARIIGKLGYMFNGDESIVGIEHLVKYAGKKAIPAQARQGV